MHKVSRLSGLLWKMNFIVILQLCEFSNIFFFPAPDIAARLKLLVEILNDDWIQLSHLLLSELRRGVWQQ